MYYIRNENLEEIDVTNEINKMKKGGKYLFVSYILSMLLLFLLHTYLQSDKELTNSKLNQEKLILQKQNDSLKQELLISNKINKGLSNLRRNVLKRLPNHLVSYYTPESSSNLTANGEYYTGKDLTCASNIHPFGTKLRITNPQNNKYIIVRVNDRGGFTKYGRTLDLSYYAFSQIGNIKSGVLICKIEKV